MSMQRHRWQKIEKAFGYESARCERCNLVRINRHDRNYHWIEWKRGDEFIKSDKTPQCVRGPSA